MANIFPVSSSGRLTLLKDPDAILDYTWDWTEWLDDVADTLLSHEYKAPTGIAIDQSGIVGKTVVAIISGGSTGTTYPVTCHIVTAGGREDDRTLYLKIVER